MKLTLSQADSGHETLHSDEDSPTPTLERASSEVIYSSISNNTSNVMIGSAMSGIASGASAFARSRRSLAEPSNIIPSNHLMTSSYYGQSTNARPASSSNSTTPGGANDGGPIYEDIDQYHHHPPMIAPVSGVPNLKGKSVIRPIAFRPTPGPSSGASTPTNGYVVSSFRPPSSNFDFGGPHPNVRASPATSMTHMIMGGAPPPPPPHPTYNNEGFAPGHPLVKDGRRHYGSSQELHVAQAPPGTFNKFNSLDRRAISRRHQHINNGVNPPMSAGGLPLKLLPNSGSESLPVNMSSSYHRIINGNGGSHQASPNLFNNGNTNNNNMNSNSSMSSNNNNNNIKPSDIKAMKEPERRHSSYDPASRAAGNTASCNSNGGPPVTTTSARYRLCHSNSTASNSSTGKGSSTAPINISGLPDPFGPPIASSLRGISNPGQPGQHLPGNSSIYSSQESLTLHHHQRSSSVGGCNSATLPNAAISPRSASATRPSAGTPQFQNLSGAVRTVTSSVTSSGVSSSSNRSVTNLNGGVVGASLSSPAYVSVSVMNRSMSGHNLNQFEVGSSSSHGSSDMNQTPSPSDSAVSDMETVLKEKDSEINFLRETMEQNEQVIFKVYEEKEKMWERELRKLKGLYDNRLRASQQKSSKMEQALTNQTYQLQNERRRLEREVEEIRRQKEDQWKENEKLKTQLDSLRSTLDGQTGDELLNCTSEPASININHNNNNNNSSSTTSLSELQVQTKELRLELERKDVDLRELQLTKLSLQNEVSNLKTLLDTGSGSSSSGFGHGSSEEEDDEKEILSQKEIIIARDQEIEKLQKELEVVKVTCQRLKDEAQIHQETFETEKASWMDEKEKVIRYQKQLQLNYVQMYKRNKTLEAEIESLNKSLADQELRNKELVQLQQQQQQQQQQSSKSSSGSSKSSATSRLQKTGNSVRARLFKMSLHSESQC